MTARTPWHALTTPHYLRTPWPARSAAYLLSSVLTGLPALLALLLLGVFSLALVGLPLLLLAGLPLAAVERWRLLLVDRDPAADPHRTPAEP
ncbi:MAG TPA: sensor domain-containing protein, partial [Streptomyces sp.]|nr:sensor domain-containing protein [Streptomyces sp.]